MSSRFGQIFAAARAESRCALIPYITAGDPSLAATVAIGRELARAGAAIIELGVPFSDPVADGPVIQAASERALAHGTRLADVLACARQIREGSDVGLLIFSYYNPILQYGLGAFAREAAAAGVDGALVTDLIPEESAPFRLAAREASLDTVFLAAPTSPDSRLATIASVSTGFIYAVSRLGVTGAVKPTVSNAEDLVSRLRKFTRLPVAVGFGLSQPEQVRDVARFADGVVVGSALVERIAQSAPDTAPAAASSFLRSLANGAAPPSAR